MYLVCLGFIEGTSCLFSRLFYTYHNVTSNDASNVTVIE